MMATSRVVVSVLPDAEWFILTYVGRDVPRLWDIPERADPLYG